MKNFTVHWRNGDTKDFPGPSALVAFIRALSYTFVTKKNSDIEFLVDDADCKIYYKWDWNVQFSELDRVFIPGSIKTYSEDEVEQMILTYARYVGNSKDHAEQWFDLNKKK